MILVIDIGNTHTVIGAYKGDDLVVDWRLKTDQHQTGDEYGVILQSLFNSEGFSFDSIEGVIISCVVPPMISTMEKLCKKYFNQDPAFIGPETDMGMKICYENPMEVGADRIVNSVAAFEKYRRSLIVIDFGTATTFDYISPNGEYMGGAIAPGIAISGEALFDKASKLPRVDFVGPERVVGRNTVNSMQAGIVFGHVSMVDGIVQRIKDEVKTAPFVVATGGLAPLISSHAKTIDEVDEYLTLRGLKIIFDRNSKQKMVHK
jgi:type III pantothenate kinase